MGNIIFGTRKRGKFEQIRVIAWKDVIDIDIGEERFLATSTIRLHKEDAIRVAKYILEEYDETEKNAEC